MFFCDMPPVPKIPLALSRNTDDRQYVYFAIKRKISIRYTDVPQYDTVIAVPDIDEDVLKSNGLAWFRYYLYTNLGVSENSCILYTDNDGDEIPINSQCEFLEAWKFARSCAEKYFSVLLTIKKHKKERYAMMFYETLQESEETHNASATDEAETIKKNVFELYSRKNVVNTVSNDNFNVSSMATDTRIKEDVPKIMAGMNKLMLENKVQNVKTCNCSLDNGPPTWFEDYMRTMKKSIVTEISNKVITSVEEILNKRAPGSSTGGQCPQWFKNQQTLPLKKHSRYTSNLCQEEKRKHKKKKKAVKELNISDISLDPEDKKSWINNITEQERVELQNKLAGRLERLENKIFIIGEKKKRCCDRLKTTVDLIDKMNEDMKRLRRLKKVVIPYDTDGSKVPRLSTKEQGIKELQLKTIRGKKKLREELERLKEKSFVIREEKKHYHNILKTINNLDKSNKKREEADENLYENNLNSAPKCIENELRMNCSITGHQMLDETHKKTMCCSASDVDNLTVCSDVSNASDVQDEHNFEMIQMPDCNLENLNCTSADSQFEEEQEKNYSNKIFTSNTADNFVDCKCDSEESSEDSPSFEVLSETPSPPLSIYIDDDHFSSNEINIFMGAAKEGDARKRSANLRESEKVNQQSIPYIIDINGKIHNKYVYNVKTDSSVDDLEKRSGGTYSFIADTLPACGKEKTADPVSNNFNINLDYDHHEDYSKNKEQNDLGESAQSFHSHTTSLTDNDIYSNSTCNHSYSKHTLFYSKHADSSAQRKSETSSEESRKSFKAEAKESENAEDNQKHSRPQAGVRAEPVIILPETMVRATTTVASYAFGTALEIIDKIRTHKEDRGKRRGWRR